MKNLLGKLKGLKFKKALIEHGEKFALGSIALIALMCCWASLRSGYDKTPTQLEELANKSMKDLKNSTMPEETLAKFALSGAYQLARDLLFKPLEADLYAYGPPMFWPVIPPKEQIKDPEYRPVEYLVVASGKTVLELAPVQASADDALEMENSDTADEPKKLADTDDPDLARPENAKEIRKPAKVPAAGDETEGIGGRRRATRKARGEETSKGTSKSDNAKKKDSKKKDTKEAPLAHDQSLGARYVAVRGIFDLKKQLNNFRNANIPNPTVDLIEFVDFELERQRAIDGEDAWSGPWEPVELERAKQILDETADFTIDVVDPLLKDSVVTMPLPQRLIGQWSSVASHPRIEDYKMSDEEAEIVRKEQEKLMEDFNKLEAEQQVQKGPKKGGFASQQFDYRTVKKTVETATPDNRNQGTGRRFVISPLGRTGGGDRREARREGRQMALPGSQAAGTSAGTSSAAHASPVGKWILFRYIDFDVEPGEAYRYRVRLTLVNPNAQREIADVTDPSVITGPTRNTKWSEPSPIAIVKEDTRMFLTKVEHKKGNERGKAWIEIFQWDPKVGTMISDALDVVLGQVIGKRNVMSFYLDLAIPSFRKEPVSFVTRDVLVDSYLSSEILVSEHPDLELKAKPPGTRPQPIGIPDQAAVVDRYGQLVAYNTVPPDDRDLKAAKSRLEAERKDYVDLLEDTSKKKKAKKGEDEKSKTANPMRRRRGRGGRGRR